MRFLFINLIFSSVLYSCYTPNQTVITATSELYSYKEYITADYLRNHLEFIAHDSLKGRQTGSEGIRSAARYLADYHEQLEMTPIGDNRTYFQHFDLNARTLESITFRTSLINHTDTTLIDESTLRYREPANYTHILDGHRPLNGEIIFAGFGAIDPYRDIDQFGDKDLSGTLVMVFEQMPHNVNGETLIDPAYTNRDRFFEILNERNAAGIIVISDYDEESYMAGSEIRSLELLNPLSLSLEEVPAWQRYTGSYFSINPELAARLLDLQEGAQDLTTLRDELIRDIQTFRAYRTGAYLDITPQLDEGVLEAKNVISYLEGGDPDLKDEVVVLIAHYDHVGVGTPDENGDYIFNGADDNGSGTVAMLSIARTLKEAADAGIRPRRSILFLHVSAEEWGLYGSRYYTDNPIIPIEQTVANLNMDMIGRRDEFHIDRDETDFIYIIGAEIISSDLDSLLQEGNRKSVNLNLNMRYNNLNDPNQFYRRSDHWNFGRLEVPFIFFFSGVHEDYHAQGDTVDKILFDTLEKRARLIYATTLEIANADKRPEVDSEEFIRRTRSHPR